MKVWNISRSLVIGHLIENNFIYIGESSGFDLFFKLLCANIFYLCHCKCDIYLVQLSPLLESAITYLAFCSNLRSIGETNF